MCIANVSRVFPVFVLPEICESSIFKTPTYFEQESFSKAIYSVLSVLAASDLASLSPTDAPAASQSLSLARQLSLATDLSGLQLGSGTTTLLLRLDSHLASTPAAAEETAEEPPVSADAPEDAGSPFHQYLKKKPHTAAVTSEPSADKIAQARGLVSELLANGVVLLELEVRCVFVIIYHRLLHCMKER